MSEQAWAGGQVTERAHCVLAPNPGPMTLDGTNTWVLLEPGGTEAVVIDPGPLDEGHLARVVDTVASMGARVTETILTHGHHDHAEAAPRFAEPHGDSHPGRRPRPRRPLRRLRHHGGRTRDQGRRHTGSHERLRLVRARGRPFPAHGRHGPGARHHGGRAPGW